MNRRATISAQLPNLLEAQQVDVHAMSDVERDSLIISAIEVDGQWVILSRYGDPRWKLTGGPTNKAASQNTLDFVRLPDSFRAVAKAIIYRYLRRGREGQVRPGAASVVRLFTGARHFLRYLDKLNLMRLGAVTPMVCANFVAECRGLGLTVHRKDKRPEPVAMLHRFGAIEAIYELSQYTSDPMPQHPWPDTSAWVMAGMPTYFRRLKQVGGTPLIPDDVFTSLFKRAHALVEQGNELLDLRDAVDAVPVKGRQQERHARLVNQNRQLKSMGWNGGLKAFSTAILELRTACYIVLASVSGCRNHELAFVQTGAVHRTQDDEGIVYCWMRSQSTKTDAGYTEWMIPEVAVAALSVMERWSRPYRAMIDAEIAERRSASPIDPEIAEAQRHRDALFLGVTRPKGNQVRTVSDNHWNMSLKAFAKACGLDWRLASHQFRRKFANYAARSQFGDLRYLREHFKHWSMDMTLAYALNESQEWDVYLEIKDELDDIKLRVADKWFDDEPLAGGYGKNIMAWRSKEENVALFKDRAAMVRSIAESTAIRSNGHAWCTADDNGCIGNTLERTRCSGCNNAVIGRAHYRLYQRLYDDLRDVLKCDDIGPSGQARLRRDMARCREVLVALGYDPEEARAHECDAQTL